MDIALPPRPRRARWILSGAAGLAVVAATVFLGRLKPAAPQAERGSLLVDGVKRGAMVFQVRGTGTLVPVDVRMITAQVSCKVERILLFPGTEVKEDSVIAELSSPELQQAAEDAYWQMRRAEADYQVDHLNQKATLNAAKASTQEARAVLLATERLQKEGLQSDLDTLRARVRAEEVSGRLEAEEAPHGALRDPGHPGGAGPGPAGTGQGPSMPSRADRTGGLPQGEGRHGGHPPAGAPPDRPAARAGGEPGQGGQALPPQGRAQGERDPGQGHPRGAARGDRHPQRRGSRAGSSASIPPWRTARSPSTPA